MDDKDKSFMDLLGTILENYPVSDARIRCIQEETLTMMRKNPEKVAKVMEGIDFGTEIEG